MLYSKAPIQNACVIISSGCLLQAIATCVSSFASIGYYSSELYERAAEHIMRSVMYADMQVTVHAGTFIPAPALQILLFLAFQFQYCRKVLTP